MASRKSVSVILLIAAFGVVALGVSRSAACIGDCLDLNGVSASFEKQVGADSTISKGFVQNAEAHLTQTKKYDSGVALDHGLPLQRRYQALVGLANGGDRKAACVLAWSLDFCSKKNRFLSEIEHRMGLVDAEELSGSTRTEAAKLAAVRYDLLATESESLCKGFERSSEEDVALRMYQAAALGDVRSMARFALNPPMGDGVDLSNVEILSIYKEKAKEFLVSAALAGDGDAVIGVYSVYTRGYLQTRYGKLPMKIDKVTVATALTAMSGGSAPDEPEKIRDLLDGVRASMTDEEKKRLGAIVARHEKHGIRFGSTSDRDGFDERPRDACDSR